MSQEISRVAVLGAGTMGLGIAHVSALAGYETRLFDPYEKALERAGKTIERNLAKGVERGKVDAEDAGATLARLSRHDRLEPALDGADLLIEAVPEDMELKVGLFQQADAAAPDHCLFASNTSGLSITEMAGASGPAPAASPGCTSSTRSTS